MNKFDVIILGGGPAGCAAAIALVRDNFRVALIEKTRYASPRVGETLAPAARVPLAQLGALEKFLRADHAPSPGTRAAWGSAELAENHFIANPYGHGWHLDRNRFDAMLFEECVSLGVCGYVGAKIGDWRLEIGSWKLGIEIDEESKDLHGTWVIDATGRAGIISRQQGAQRLEVDRLVGLVKFCDARDAAQDNRTLVEASRDGWWYSAFLPDARLVVAYMTDADLKPRDPAQLPEFFSARLAETRHTRGRLLRHCENSILLGGMPKGRNAERVAAQPRWAGRGQRGCPSTQMEVSEQDGARSNDAGVSVFSASSYILDRVAGENWSAVGDAAMAVDPLSARGIYNALESGLRAARALAAKNRGDANAFKEYAAWMRARYERYSRARARYYAQETRWRDSEFWRRRQISTARFDNAGERG